MRLHNLKHAVFAVLMNSCLLFCFGLISPAAFAQEPAVLSLQLEDQWFTREQLLNEGKQTEADAVLERIKQLRIERDIDNLDLLAASLLREAQSSLDQGNLNRAVSLTRSAIELAPNFPVSYFFLFRVLIRPDQLFLGEAFENYFSGWHEWFNNFMAQLSLLNSVILAFLLAVLASYGIFFAIVLIRAAPLLGHEITELIRGPFHGPLSLGYAVVILALPMFFGLNFGWIISYWIVLAWFYLSTRERLVTASFIVFLGLSGAYLPYVISMANAPASLELRSLIQAVRGEGNPSVIEELQQKVNQDPDWWEGYFAIAQLQKKSGSYDTAIKYYEQALRKEPNSASILNNMGNAYFYLKDFNHAVDYYQQALDKDPLQIATYYNLSQTFREMLLFDKGEQIYQAGRTRNKEQMAEYTKVSALSGKVVVVDTRLPVKILWTEALTIKTRDKHDAGVFFGELFNGLPIESASGFMMAALIILVILSIARKKATIAFGCQTCSRIVCKKCQKSLFEHSVCQHCWAKLKETTRRGELAQAEEQLTRKRQVAFVMTLLLPGSGHFYLRQAVYGFLFTCFVAFILFAWWFGAGLTYPLSNVVPTIGLVNLSVTLVIFVLSYYLILKHMIKLGASLPE